MKRISSKDQEQYKEAHTQSFIQHSFGSSSQSTQTRKTNKRKQNWKGKLKTIIVGRWYDTIHRKS